MTALRLVIEIEGLRKRYVESLAEKISDAADNLFEDETFEHGRPMSLRSWTEQVHK